MLTAVETPAFDSSNFPDDEFSDFHLFILFFLGPDSAEGTIGELCSFSLTSADNTGHSQDFSNHNI